MIAIAIEIATATAGRGQPAVARPTTRGRHGGRAGRHRRRSSRSAVASTTVPTKRQDQRQVRICFLYFAICNCAIYKKKSQYILHAKIQIIIIIIIREEKLLFFRSQRYRFLAGACFFTRMTFPGSVFRGFQFGFRGAKECNSKDRM